MENNSEDQDQPSKQPSQRIPLSRLHQVDSDFVVAMALQGQERAFTSLETIESESDQENGSSESNEDEYSPEDYEYLFEAQGFEAELGFLDDEGGENSEEDDNNMDEDDVDVDELSYEELVALGEFIGVEERGLPLNEISKCLRPYEFSCKSSAEKQQNCGIDRCVICQIEYEDGEELVSVLPCEHPYHSDCISEWLQIKKNCPICSSEVAPSF